MDFANIDCSSSLHDSCGVIFHRDGRTYRALSTRGERIVNHLREHCDLDSLATLGFSAPRATEETLAGYPLVEFATIRPLIPPEVWTTEMVGRAALVVLRLSKALLPSGLVLWDLRNLQNMGYHHARGPVFLDLGALHFEEELRRRTLRTSYQSLLDQMMDSFILPLWLLTGSVRRNRIIRRLLRAKNLEPEQGLARGLIRRMSLNGWLVPGYANVRLHLARGDLAGMLELIEIRVREFLDLAAQHRSDQGDRSLLPSPPGPRLIEPLVGVACPEDAVLEIDPGAAVKIEQAVSNAPLVPYCLARDEHHGLEEETGHRVPLLYDPWGRESRLPKALEAFADVSFLGCDVYGYCARNRIPLDHFGRVISSLTRRRALVSVSVSPPRSPWPGFVTPPDGANPVQFAKEVISRHFATVTEVPESNTSKDGRYLLFEQRYR